MIFTHEYKMELLAQHIDFYGHVNNAQYLQFFEAARWDWITQHGGSRELINQIGVGPIVVEIQIKFRRELKAGERILIKSSRDGALNRLYSMKQEIFNSAGQLACSAQYKMAFFDTQRRCVVEPPVEWIRVMQG
jgi:YbgC/YbaW family acyl-CoA thioester hydrolase